MERDLGLLPNHRMVIRLPVADLDPLGKQSCSRKDCEAAVSLKILIGIFLVESSTRKICPLDMNGRYSSATSFADTTRCGLFSANSFNSVLLSPAVCCTVSYLLRIMTHYWLNFPPIYQSVVC